MDHPESPRRMFVSYSHKDRQLKDELLSELTQLEEDGVLQIWHDRNITPGERWKDKINRNLQDAEIVLLLISENFLESEVCKTEMQNALRLEDQGRILVIPIVLKPVEWQSLPVSHLQVLLTDSESITTPKVIFGIRRAVREWGKKSREISPATSLVDPTPHVRRPPADAVRSIEITAKGPEFRYRNLFRIGPLTIPYIVLMNSLEPEKSEHTYGELGIVLRPDRWDKLPHEFDIFSNSTRPVIEHETKCRFESLGRHTGGARPFRLKLEFSEISYRDYMKSGEHLDALVPGSQETFRDRYAPDPIYRYDFSRSPLTNITGVGVFLVTRDDRVIISRHSADVLVHPNTLSYSASGTMDWKKNVHPFDEMIRECREELGYELSVDDLRLFSIGIDAKRQYFQFSFYANIPHSAAEITGDAAQAEDSWELGDVASFPLDVATIVALAKEESWEPVALAALLTITAKRFGKEHVLRAIDEAWLRKQSHDIMATEWKRRASLPGHFAVSSSRYPQDELPEKSRAYVDAVMAFIGDDIATKDVVEFGAGIGRITQRLVKQVSRLTCVDLSEEMLKRNRELLGPASQDVAYHIGFVQDYQPSVKHDVAVASLVLIHQVSALMFTEAVDALMRSADSIFLFEHCDPAAHTSVNTKARSADELIQAFHGYNVERRSEYFLFSDRLVFLKLVRSVGPEGELTHQQR